MKKIPFLILSVFSLALGCVKTNAPEEKYSPEIKFSRTGEVILEVGIENAMSKATMNTIGEARWEKNDEIAVACTDGSIVKFKLDGTGDTRRAFFRGEIPDGKTMGDYVFYPAESIKSFDGTTVRFILPSDLASTSGTCSVMAAKITEGDFKVELKQMFAYMNVRLHGVNNASKTVQFTSDVALSGEYEVDVQQAVTEGIQAVKTTECPLTLTFAGLPDESVVLSIPVPSGIISQITATTYTSKGKKMVSTDLLTVPSITKRALTFECEGTLPKWNDKEPIPGTILLCDIYWAMGNLQYNAAGQTKTGFQQGWNFAPTQWHYFNYDIAKAFNKNSKDYDGTTLRADIPVSRDAYDHFNWGGIQDCFSYLQGYSTKAEGNFTMSGKMYTDINLSAETTDYNAAKYGDLAFWASKGQWRLPNENELKTLFEKANAQYGYVLIKDETGAQVKVNDIDLKVWGWLFTEPTEPRVVEKTEREITATELTDGNGLFLPLGGRKANSSDTQAISTRNIGIYWSGTTATVTASGYNSVYSISLNLGNGSMKFGYEYSNAYDRKSGFFIRPVYIPKN